MPTTACHMRFGKPPEVMPWTFHVVVAFPFVESMLGLFMILSCCFGVDLCFFMYSPEL